MTLDVKVDENGKILFIGGSCKVKDIKKTNLIEATQKNKKLQANKGYTTIKRRTP